MYQFDIRDENNILRLAVVAGLVLLVLLPLSTICKWRETPVRVTSTEWTRAINIQRLNTYHGEGFGAPLGIFTTYTYTKPAELRGHFVTNSHRHTRTVTDHNGRSKTEDYTTYTTDWEYDWYYFYKWDQWDPHRTVPTHGFDSPPVWGEYKLLDRERVVTPSETYILHLEGAEDKLKYNDLEKPLNEWLKIKKGFTFIAALNIWGSILSLRE